MKDMKKTTTIFGLLIATFVLSAQSINANFEVDKEGWTSHQSTVKWSNLFSPMADRGGISFSRENQNEGFLFIEKEVADLLPNRNYRVIFNMNWLAWLETSASPIVVKVGASNDFIVAGRLTPNPNGYPFLQNVNNFNNAFFVNTDHQGRLFLMIGIETENEKIEQVYLNTLRVLLRENGEARDISPVEILSNVETTLPTESIVTNEIIFEIDETISENITAEVVFVTAENGFVFFESDYNDEVEMVNIFKDDHLMKVFRFRNPTENRAFQTTGLPPATYRIEFVLFDGRTINELLTIEN